jgi:excisionase family DNA binding protein
MGQSSSPPFNGHLDASHSPTKPLLLRAREVAVLLGISRALAYRWMACGILPTVRQGRSIRVPRAALLLWIQKNTRYLQVATQEVR